MVSLFPLLGCNLSYIVELFAGLHELASASTRTLLKLASASVRALLKPCGDPLTWCGNIFVGCSVTPTFFRQITSFSDCFHYTKKQKNLYVGSCNYFLYTIQKGSNWYMDRGVRDLEVAFSKANFIIF